MMIMMITTDFASVLNSFCFRLYHFIRMSCVRLSLLLSPFDSTLNFCIYLSNYIRHLPEYLTLVDVESTSKTFASALDSLYLS